MLNRFYEYNDIKVLSLLSLLCNEQEIKKIITKLDEVHKDGKVKYIPGAYKKEMQHAPHHAASI